MRCLAAAAAALLMPLALAAPAAAENRSFAAQRGDADRPANDIVSYSVNHTDDRVAVVVHFAAPNTDELDLLHDIDVNGDGTTDYIVTDEEVYRERDVESVCRSTLNRTGVAAGVSFAASCIGSPASLRVQVYASSGVFSDWAPSSAAFSPAVRRGGEPAAPPPPVTSPHAVTLAVAPTTIRLGANTLAGVAARPGEVIGLYARPNAATPWKLIRAERTSGAGYKGWVLKPGNTTTFFARPIGAPQDRNSAQVTVSVLR